MIKSYLVYTLPLLLCFMISTPIPTEAQVLADGTYNLPFSTGPGDPNFNSALTRMHTMPLDLDAKAGSQLIVSLRDTTQPDQFCDPDDPTGGIFEGCATIDWPFPGRRGINLVEVQTVAGLETLHLRMGDILSPEEEPEGP